MRKMSKILIVTGAFTVEAMAAIVPGPVPDIKHISSLVVEISLLSLGSHFLYVSFDLHQTQVPSCLCPMQIVDSSQIIIHSP